MTIEELEKKYNRLEQRFNRLLSCLYPNSIGLQDVEFIGREKEDSE